MSDWLNNLFKRLAALMQKPVSDPSEMTILRGDGSWPWSAHIDGDDIVILGARATCFGGSKDPQDSGETASGISTKLNPTIRGCALPLIYTGTNKALQKALGGSPLPKIPWHTQVRITTADKALTVPLIDLGPAKRTGNAVDLTVAAAQYFKKSASAINFEMMCDVRIIGAARYVKGGSVA